MTRCPHVAHHACAQARCADCEYDRRSHRKQLWEDKKRHFWGPVWAIPSRMLSTTKSGPRRRGHATEDLTKGEWTPVADLNPTAHSARFTYKGDRYLREKRS